MKPMYLIADTHFGHQRLVDVYAERPGNFEQTVLLNLKKLPADSVLVHLGDFCIGDDERWHKMWDIFTQHIQHRILVRGNHDNKSDNWYYQHGWDFVCRFYGTRLYGKNVLFSHRPKEPARYPGSELNIHGHTHGNTHRDEEAADYYSKDFHLEIALEQSGYAPVLVNEKLLRKELGIGRARTSGPVNKQSAEAAGKRPAGGSREVL